MKFGTYNIISYDGLTPVWKHDCEACTFIGTMTHILEGTEHDIYLCLSKNDVLLDSSLIVRDSDNPPDYHSRPLGMCDMDDYIIKHREHAMCTAIHYLHSMKILETKLSFNNKNWEDYING